MLITQLTKHTPKYNKEVASSSLPEDKNVRYGVEGQRLLSNNRREFFLVVEALRILIGSTQVLKDNGGMSDSELVFTYIARRRILKEIDETK